MKVLDKYIELYKVEIEDIKSFILTLTDDDWNIWSHRQNSFDQHSKTKTYPLVWAERLNNDTLSVTIKNKFNYIWDILTPQIEDLERRYDGRCMNIMFTKLLSGEKILPHIDSDYLTEIHRCHLPIITNKDVSFYIDNEPLHLNEGVFYEINNQLLHSVENNSLEDRIHLIIDVLPKSSNLNLQFICE